MDSAQPRPVSMQEALRTIGSELDRRGAKKAQLVVDARGVTVDGRGEQDAYLQYSWSDLGAESRLQAARRAPPEQPPQIDPWALTRWAVLLRVTGQLLDTQGVNNCTVEAALGATSDALVLRVLVAGEEVFRRTEVGVELWRLRSQAQSRVAAALGPPKK